MMKLNIKMYITGIVSAAALCLPLPPPASASQDNVVVIKEKSMPSDIVADSEARNATADIATANLSPGRERQNSARVGGKTVTYVSRVAGRTTKELVLCATLNKPQDDVTLGRLASRIYMENGGNEYQHVTIYWHIGGSQHSNEIWARTQISNGSMMYKMVKLHR